MTVAELAEQLDLRVFTAVNDTEVNGVYCCDLLSNALAKLKNGEVFVTVMNNANVAAIAYNNTAACVILTESATPDPVLWNSAAHYNVCLLGTELDTFSLAVKLGRFFDTRNS